MHQGTFLFVLRRHAALLAVASVLGLLCAGVWWWTKPASYHSSATVFFTANQGASGTELHQISVFAKESASTYALLATTPRVLEPVISSLGLTVNSEELATRVTTSVPVDSALVDISVSASHPDDARRRTEAVATSLIAAVDALPPRTRDGKAALIGTLYRPATTAQGPSLLKGAVVMVGCAVLAAAAVGAVALARHLARPLVTSGSDLARLLRVPLWGGFSVRGDTLADIAAPLSAWANTHSNPVVLWCGVQPDDDLTRSVEATRDALTAQGMSTQWWVVEGTHAPLLASGTMSVLPAASTPKDVRDRVDAEDAQLSVVVAPPLQPGSRSAFLAQTCTGVLVAATVARTAEADVVLAGDLVRNAGGTVVAAHALPAAGLAAWKRRSAADRDSRDTP